MRIALAPDDDIATLVRAAERESVVVDILAGRDPLTLAAIGPLALERAPAIRGNAVVRREGASEEDVEAVVRFLEGARSTTGQVIEVG